MAKVTAKSQDKEITCAGLKRAVTTLTLDDGENKAEIPVKNNDIEVDTLVGKINDKSRM